MVRTRAGRGSSDPVADSARSTRSMRRRAVADNTAARSSAARSAKGKGKAKATSIPDDEEDADEDEEEEEEEEEDEEEEIMTGQVARFGAPKGRGVKSISPPPQSESEMGSQNISATQRANAGYTRYSSVVQPPEASVSNAQEDQPQNPQGESNEEKARELVEMRQDALDALWHNSEMLANLLFDAKPGKRHWTQLLTVFRNNWSTIQLMYVEKEGDLFIDLPTVLESFDKELHERGRVIVAGANATAVQNEMEKGQASFPDLLAHLDMGFPIPFLTFVPEQPLEAITDELIDLALDIRTQGLIETLKVTDEDKWSPADVAAVLFCKVDESMENHEMVLEHGPYQDICATQTEQVGQRAKDILRLIQGKSTAEAIASLEEVYPFDAPDGEGFYAKLDGWSSQVIKDAREYFRGNPPASTRGESSPARSLTESSVQQVVRRDVHEDMITRNTVHYFARLIQQTQASRRSPSAPRPPREPTAPAPDPAPQEDDDGPRQASPAPSDDFDEAVIALARSSQQRPPQPQPEAGPTTAPPRSSAGTSQLRTGFAPINGPSNGSSSKRPRPDDEDDEDPFEEDTREPNAERREQLERDRANMPPPSSRPQKRRRLPSPPSSRPPASSAPVRSEPPASSAARQPPPSTNPSRQQQPNGDSPARPSSSSRPPSSAGSSAGEISFSQIREANRLPMSQRSGLQQRVPWSDRDVGRLIRLIGEHNCVWAKIARRQTREGRLGEPGIEEREDLIFDHPRDQQAIRDKARNLKVDLLKADLPLYPGFDGIALGKKERQALINRGKNPDRAEADVDIDGNPFNTQYLADDDQ